MTRDKKAQVIEELTSKLQDTSTFYLTDASGLTVAEINAFRSKCFEKGVKYKVYKNTLIKKAFDNLEKDYSELENSLKGFTGVMFADGENASDPAKILKGFREGSDKPLLKGAMIDTDVFIGDDNIASLSKLKSKQELIGEVIGLLQSPAKNVISALSSGQDTLAGLIKTLADRAE